MRKLLLIGGGGHCLSVLDSINSIGLWDEIGIVDNKLNDRVGNIPIVGTDSDLKMLFEKGWKEAFISLGSVGCEDMARRRLRYQDVKRIGFEVPRILDPSAIIAENVVIKEGVYVGKKAIINPGVLIQECVIINSGAIVEHNCKIGSFCHVSPGTILCGHVNVGESTHIGAGTVVKQELTIGRNVLIGIGSVVVKNISDSKKAYGTPCKEVV